MNCEKCGSRSTVTETRTDRDQVGANEYGTVHRRRKCLTCKILWTTSEIRDDRLDDYDQQVRAERAEKKLKTARSVLRDLFDKL